jgi:hypothetical protein
VKGGKQLKRASERIAILKYTEKIERGKKKQNKRRWEKIKTINFQEKNIKRNKTKETERNKRN